MGSDEREFDIVLWGATGFAGRFVAEHLAERYADSDLHWTVAGRNRQALGELRDDLRGEFGALGGVDPLVGDATDRSSLDAIAERTRVVCSTVGPYAEYGGPLVAACVDGGADYCDLTGEVHWMREMIDRHHDEARKRGVRIVHACGFDSIPSDLGTLLLQREAADRFGRPCRNVRLGLVGGSGGFSGGTIASMAQAFETARDDRDARRIMTDPYGLNPPGRRSGPDGPPQQGVRWDEVLESWTAPFIMAMTNEKVVRRSHALLDDDYGPSFRYREVVDCGRGVSSALRAAATAAGTGAFAGAMALGPTRNLLRATLLPAPGEGPSEEKVENGFFKLRIVGKTPAEGGRRLAVEVAADADPGYGATSVMLGESAVALARDETDGVDGGVLTSAAALGLPVVARLREAGMTWRVEEPSAAAAS